MALNWLWTDKIGTCKMARYGEEYECTLYSGNALLIAIYHNNEQYSLSWFAADKDHLKNMLGLTKGYDYCLESLIEISLDTKYKGTKQIVKLLADAGHPISITLY